MENRHSLGTDIAPKGIGFETGYVDLSAIDSLSSITMLIVNLLVNVGHLRFVQETGAKRTVVLSAVLTCLGTLALFVHNVFPTAPKTAGALALFVGSAFIGKTLLQKLRR